LDLGEEFEERGFVHGCIQDTAGPALN
jgi:hypothetical protein